MSIQAFFSPAIRETMTVWENNKAAPFQISEATIEAIDNIKNNYPRIQSWNPRKILQRISSNWESRHDLGQQENRKTMDTIKEIKKKDFSDRMNKNLGNNFNLQKQLDTETLENLAKSQRALSQGSLRFSAKVR